MPRIQAAYRSDLAYVHDAGFCHLAASAAVLAIDVLKRSGIHDGTIVELGCGSGISSRLFRDAGFSVIGIDLSEALIAMARARVPDADFRIGSFVSAEIPACVAVTAIGEIFNYAFDEANGDSARTAVVGRIHAALAPRGLLVFDMAGPARAPASSPQRTYFEAPDWTVLVQTEADDAKSVLTRRITTFRKQAGAYRRDSEIHKLQLVEPIEVVTLLRTVGFSVQTLDSYGAQTLQHGLTGFLARKPAVAAAL